MKIAIHHTPDSKGFSERWINYCEKNCIDYKIVNAYDSNIVEQVADCDAFMWHHHHFNYKDVLFAKQLLYSLEMAGKKVFPSWRTGWHFDDKVGQKYLLEAIGAPLVPSYVFYTKTEAFNWIKNSSFPKVFKLRGGAGSTNVLLAHTAREARKMVNKAFGKGYSQYDAWSNLRERWRKWRTGKTDIVNVAKGVIRFVYKPEFAKMHAPEKGYVYFQDYITNNTYDIRICIVANKAFALKRLVRDGDFRASGSGKIVYDKKQIDERCVKIAFEVSKQLGLQCIGVDFVFDNDMPMIVEMGYGFTPKAYDDCEGYWSEDMNWHEGAHFDFCGWMVDTLTTEKNNNI